MNQRFLTLSVLSIALRIAGWVGIIICFLFLFAYSSNYYPQDQTLRQWVFFGYTFGIPVFATSLSMVIIGESIGVGLAIESNTYHSLQTLNKLKQQSSNDNAVKGDKK